MSSSHLAQCFVGKSVTWLIIWIIHTLGLVMCSEPFTNNPKSRHPTTLPIRLSKARNYKHVAVCINPLRQKKKGKVHPLYRHWGKVKCTLVQALRLCTGRTAHRGSRGIALIFRDHCSRRGWGVSVTPRPLFTPGKTRYPLYRRLGGPQRRSGQVRRISPQLGFGPRTVQPVASRNIDYATRPTTP